MGVYPRPRGEYVARIYTASKGKGLPPPTRGIPPIPRACKVVAGSTPAHAGNTSGDYAPDVPASVYPRPRGEYNRLCLRLRRAAGLPPPTRGIPYSV